MRPSDYVFGYIEGDLRDNSTNVYIGIRKDNSAHVEISRELFDEIGKRELIRCTIILIEEERNGRIQRK